MLEAQSWLAFVHPAFAVLGLLLALASLRLGLSMRDLRRRRLPAPKGSLRRHTRLSRSAVLILLCAFGLGLLSTPLLRHWPLFGSAHGWLGLAAAACFGATGVLGLRRDRQRAALHGALGLCGLALGLLAALSGIELLP